MVTSYLQVLAFTRKRGYVCWWYGCVIPWPELFGNVMNTFTAFFEIADAINCPLYAKGDRMSLTDKTFSCPKGKEVCLILVRDMTQLLFVMLSEQEPATAKKLYSCSGCTGLIKFRQASANPPQGRGTSRMQALLQELHGRKVASPFLDALPPGKMNSIMEKFRQVTVPKKTLLVQEGEINHNIYLILTGVFVIESGGKPVNTIREGEIFGEMSYLGVELAVASVRAQEDALVMAISARDFGDILSSSASVQLYMAKLLAGRLQQVNQARARDFESAMTGRLHEVVPAELFQVFHMHQKTGVLEMNLVHGEARVSFREGCIINASYAEKKNEQAIFAMLAEKEGYYRFTTGLSAQEMKAAEIGDFMALLMEGVKRVDEVSGN